MLRALDATFATWLKSAGKTDDAAERTASLAEARAALFGYRAFTADKLLADLDDNPFAPLTLRADLGATIAQLAAELR